MQKNYTWIAVEITVFVAWKLSFEPGQRNGDAVIAAHIHNELQNVVLSNQ
jgi:hypothetical protein